ncbi:unnamed protein product [Heterobilharzia americana]|nr:unnamed protein product [Heterobilharzia americana]
MQNSSSSFSAEHDLVDTRTIQTRRQSARIGAKKIKKADCKREEEVFEYCRQTKRSDAITRSGSKLSLHLKKNNPIRRRRLKSHLGRSQDSSNHSSDSEENDPERLWCICRKPHDERFMICCDLCDEWYHGDCVGIKPEEGKRMEKNEIEFVCDSCKLMGAYGDKTDNVHSTQLQSFLGSDDFAEYSSIDSPSVTTSVSTASGLTASIVNSLRLRLNEEAEKECDKQLTVLHNTTNTALKYLSEDESSVSESFSTSVNSTEDNNLTVITNENELPPVNGPHVPLYHPSVGVTDTLQSVHLPKSFLRRKKKPRFSLDNESTEHVNSMNACLGPNCNRTINPQISLYCSNKCLKAYGMDVLRIVCRKHGSDPQDKSHHLDTHKTLVVLDRRSGTVLNGTRAPTSNNLIEFLSVHQTFQVVYDRQSNERSQKSTSLNQTTKCSVQNEASARTTANVIKNSEQDFCRSPSSLLSEPISQQSLVPENVDRLRKKYQNLLLVLLEKRTQASRHIFTANRSRLKMLAEELETVISTRNNLINSPAPTDANSSFEQDLPTYKCQLRLFLSCLDAVGQDKSQHCPVPSSTTDPSIILRDQFFDSLISGVLKPSDLAHCQNIKTLESIVRRARLADSVQNKISLGTSVVSSNVNTNQPDLCATSTQTSTTITPSNNPLTSVPALSQPTEVDKHTNEALDTTSEHGKHLYDMHCKRCTGQTKQPMKLPSSKKSVPSPSPPPSSGASLSLLSVKTESVSNTFSSEKISPDPNSTELSLSKSSISPAAILAEKTVPVSVKLSPKSADECSVFNKPNYLEDRKNMVKCLDPRKESISLQNSVNHHMSKMQLNQKRSHPSFEEYCPVSIFTHDKSIPPKSLSSCYHPPPPINSFVSTGLLDLPLPPAQHNSSFTSQSDDNDSVSPPYIVKEKINSKCCLWTGMLSLSTQYSGREHMYSLEINVHPFGYIHAKVSNDSRKVFIETLYGNLYYRVNKLHLLSVEV